MNYFIDGKIFKIASKLRPNVVYVGSTYRELDKLLEHYKQKYQLFLEPKNKQKYLECFEIIKRGDCSIELLENFPCENFNQMKERELYFIQTLNCVNSIKRSRISNVDARVECECGTTFKKSYKRVHELTSKHVAYFNKVYDEIEELKELNNTIQQNIIEEPATNLPEIIPS